MSDQWPAFGTPAWYERFLNRFDVVTVQIAFVDHPDQVPREVVIFDVDTDTSGWDRDLLTRGLLDLCRDGQGRQRYPNTLQIYQNYYGWGAAGAGEQILLQVAIGALNPLFRDAVRNLVQRMHVRGGGSAMNPAAMDVDAAVDRARRRVALRYATTKYAELTITFESQDTKNNTWEVHLKDREGYRYEVVLKISEGYDTIRLSRAEPDS